MARKRGGAKARIASESGPQAYKRKIIETLDDPKCEGPLGSLFLAGSIGALEIEAARRFVALVRRYGHTIGTSFAPAKVSNFGRIKGMALQADYEDQNAESDFDAVRDLVGATTLRELIGACLYGEAVGGLVVHGLAALVGYFGLCEDDVADRGPARVRGWRQIGAKPMDRPDLRLTIDNTRRPAYA